MFSSLSLLKNTISLSIIKWELYDFQNKKLLLFHDYNIAIQKSVCEKSGFIWLLHRALQFTFLYILCMKNHC